MKRTCYILMLAGLLTAAAAVPAAPKVATSDWAVAETLTAIGLPPVSLGDKRAYQTWVAQPMLPPTTADAGLRFQPNLESLYRSRPDLFVQTPWFAHLHDQFARIAPVHEIRFAGASGIEYAQLQTATRQLGRLLDHERAADTLIADTERQLQQQRQLLQQYRHRPLAVVQFVDARHLRIYGRSSLYHATLTRLGLHNAWQGDANEWGFAQIGLAELARLPENTLLIIVAPHPQPIQAALAKSAVWQRLPFSRANNQRLLPPSWSYGALPAVRRFADQLTATLTNQQEHP